MKKVTMETFAKEFEKQYNFLYKNNDSSVAGYNEAIKYFDSEELTEKEETVLEEFVQYREDFIYSDRECAAFIFTFDKLYN